MLRPDAPYTDELARRGYFHRPCGSCGYSGPHELGEGAGPHPYRIRCSRCGGKVCFPPKPDNFDKRRHQSEFRATWRDLFGGHLICAICAVPEAEASSFHIDHIIGKTDAGLLIDEFWNTLPLCNICHTEKGLIQARRRRDSK